MILSIPSGFDLFGLHLNLYGITSALSYLLGVLLSILFAKKRGFKTDDILTLACYVIPCAIIGARLYYVLFRLDYYHNFWDIFKIWEGGLAFYGGMIGGALAVVLYCVIHKKNFMALVDIVCPAMLCAQALGRWGNFFNQEAFGNLVTNPALQWFPFAVYIDGLREWHQATFFYESLWNFLSFLILVVMLYRCTFKRNGVVAAFYLIFYGIGRMFIEGLRTDSLYLGSIRISQLLSGVLVIVGLVFVIFYFLKYKKKKSDMDLIMDVLKKDL